MTSTTTHAPIRRGDHVQALSNDGGATVLLCAAQVVDVRSSDDPQRPWTITYRDPHKPNGIRTVKVNDRGVDVNRYVKRVDHNLTPELQATRAGTAAIALAHSLRRRGVVGALATTTGGDNIAVVIAWPNGHDRVVAAVEVDEDAPLIVVAAYEIDHDADAPPSTEHTTSSTTEAALTIARLVASTR